MRHSVYIAAAATAFSFAYAQEAPAAVTLIANAAQIAGSVKATFTQGGALLVPQVDSQWWWWQTGIVTNALFTYGFVTGDKTYEGLATSTLFSQATGGNDFMTADAKGNDDQAWWALAAITAAENNVAVPAGQPTYSSLAQNVFNEQIARWDTTTCGGGMKFKINSGDDGYNYKSSIANGLLFQLAARLGALNNDNEALTWAEQIYNWVEATGLIDGNFNVYDGTDDSSNCATVNTRMWSYNVGAFLYGAAVMAAHTSDATWADRASGLLAAAQRNFVVNGNLVEPECANNANGVCNQDQVSFKGILARWLGSTAVVQPALQSSISSLLDGVSANAEGGWTPAALSTLLPMDQYVALETANAAIRVQGSAASAAAYGMIGAIQTTVKLEGKRSVAGRVWW